MIDDRQDTSKAAPVGGARPRLAPFAASRPQASGRPVWAGVVALVVGALVAAPAVATAQPRGGKPPPPKPAPADKVQPADAGTPTTGAGGKPKVFDFTGLDLAGRLRTPQLLYFLDRASEELERASLERRSFIPSMVRSIDESAL